MKKIAFITLAFLATTFASSAQQNTFAGQSSVKDAVQEVVFDKATGETKNAKVLTNTFA